MGIFDMEIDVFYQLWLYILVTGSIIGLAIRYHHKKTIKERVEELGGQLLSCKEQYNVFGAGPYDYTGNFGKVYY